MTVQPFSVLNNFDGLHNRTRVIEMLENLEKNLLKYCLVKIYLSHIMEKLKVVFAERGIYPYLERIALKGNTFNDGCKTGTNVMNKDYARLRSKS